MMALSIRQPWASLIISAGKDIENRGWSTRVRGRVLVHAAKGMTRAEHGAAMSFAHVASVYAGLEFTPPHGLNLTETGFGFDELQRGGIVGSVEIVDCVDASRSPWFMGPRGFVLRDPKPLPFLPCKGRLGFFDVPDFS